MEDIKKVYKSGTDNICMSIDISDEAKEKIQSYLETKIDWNSDRSYLDGVDGDINVQMPNDAESITYITDTNIDDLKFKDEESVDSSIRHYVSTQNENDLKSFINEIISEAEPVYNEYVAHQSIDENITEAQEELAGEIAEMLGEELSYRHKSIAMTAWNVSYTDGSIFMQINYGLEKEMADKIIDMAREKKEEIA
jgi:hypothetical protein